MAARPLSSPGFRARAGTLPRLPASPGAVVLALAVPLLFLHIRYQPEVTFQLRSTQVGIELSDLAVLAVAAAALATGLRHGFRPLRAGLPVWAAGAALLAMIVAATFYPRLWDGRYPTLKHLVTAAKFAEYALLAPALPLLLRRRADVLALFAAVASWSAAASTWGLLQFLGLVNEFEGRRPLQREPSFVGIHDLAALSGAAVALALVSIALGAEGRGERLLAAVAAAAGVVGVVVSGSLAGAIGIVLAAGAAGLVGAVRGHLSLRRVAALAAVALVVVLGILTLRSGDLGQLLRFLGVRHEERATRADVQTYAQRSLLAYIGVRIFLDHPVVGAGWQGSGEQENYGPHLAAAHARFPDVPEVGFPSPAHPWGVQNAYLQALADLGVVGFALFAGLLVAGLSLGARAALRAPPEPAFIALVAALWLLVAIGVWIGLGLVAGIPLDALTWLALGLAAAGATGVARARA